MEQKGKKVGKDLKESKEKEGKMEKQVIKLLKLIANSKTTTK